jgi:hypothetical protein
MSRFNLDSNWRCTFVDADGNECGALLSEDQAGKWRWTGEVWQHHHPWPMGHVTAERLLTDDDWKFIAEELDETDQ